MATTIEVSISIPRTLLDQADSLAQRLNISQNQLFESAVEKFIRSLQSQIRHVEPDPSEDGSPQMGREGKVISQGDIYWVQLENPDELDAGVAHPYVVIQDNLLNHSRINTVVACALTSNLKRVSDTPGNVLLEVGEANLPKQSVVEVSKISIINKTQLGEYIGSLDEQRIHQIFAGMRFLQMSYFARSGA